MHYATFAHLIDEKVPWPELSQHEAEMFIHLMHALQEGQGYVAIILNPEGLKIAPVNIEGSSQMTIRAKSTLRKIVHEVQIHSGASKSS